MPETKMKFIDRTLEVWQPRTTKLLSREDARQIIENVTEFFAILMEWELVEQHTISKIKRTQSDADCPSTERPHE